MQSLNDRVQANPDLGRTFHYLATMMTILMMLWKRISSGRYSTTLTYPLWSLVKLWLFMAQQEYQPASRACKRQNRVGHTMWTSNEISLARTRLSALKRSLRLKKLSFRKKTLKTQGNTLRITQESKSRIRQNWYCSLEKTYRTCKFFIL